MRSFPLNNRLSSIIQQPDKWIDRLAVFVFLATILVLPILFSPWSFDGLQLPKQSALFVLTGAFGLLWVVRCAMQRQFLFPWDRLTKVLLFAMLLLGGTAVTSIDPISSLLGMGSQIGQAWASWACLFLLFSFGRVFFSSTRRQGILIGGLVGSGFLVSALTLLGWLGIFPASSVLSRPGFNPIGSSFDLATFLLPLAALTLGCVVLNAPALFFRRSPPRLAFWGVLVISLILFLEIFLLVDFGLVWMGFGLVSSITLFLGLRSKTPRFVPGLLVTTSVVIASVVFGAHHLPGSFATLIPFNSSYALRQVFDLKAGSEVVPNRATSWKVGRAMLREHPFIGSGQGTWSYGYDRFHEVELNRSPFWKTRFPHANSFFLTLLPTIGVANILLLGLFGLMLFRRVHTIYHRTETTVFTRHTLLLLGLPLLTLFVLSFVRFLELSSLILAGSLLALVGTVLPFEGRVFPLRKERRTLVYVAGGIIAAICLCLMFIPFPRMVADARYARGLISLDRPEQAQGFFTAAHRWNPLQDNYLRALAQQETQRGLAIIASTLSSEQQQGVAHLRQALHVTQQASRRNPASADHWLDGAALYRFLSQFDPELEEGAIAYLSEAEKRQPLNPQIAHQLAQLYLQRGEREQKWIESQDERNKEEAKQRQMEAFQEARYWLDRSLWLKADFVPARYELAALNEREGKQEEAIDALERVLKDDKLNGRVMVELGLLYGQAEKYELAAQSFERFLKQEPNNPSVLWYLAATYEQLGRLDEAIVQLRLLLNQVPNDAAAQERLQLLQRAKATSLMPVSPVVSPTSTTSTLPTSSAKKKR